MEESKRFFIGRGQRVAAPSPRGKETRAAGGAGAVSIPATPLTDADGMTFTVKLLPYSAFPTADVSVEGP
jgi:hypothetical protein